MKLILKLLLVVFVLLAGVYAATPLWLPHVLARQLPPGWHLETLKSAWPGPVGIVLKSIRVSGELGSAGLTLTATNLNFNYRSHDTEIDAVSAEVLMQTGENRSNESVSPRDLSFPVMNVDTDLPRLSINRVDVALNFASNIQTDTNFVSRPLRLDLEDLELTPGTSGGFQLAGQLGFEDSLRFTGQLAAKVRPDSIDASVRFPAGGETPWLDASFEQKTQQSTTTARIVAVIDADAVNRDWLDSVMARATRRTVSQFGGKLTLDAEFAGQDQLDIERLVLSGEKLLLLSDEASLKIDAHLSAKRENDLVDVSLASPATLEYQGGAGWIDQLLGKVVPGVQLPHAQIAQIDAKVAPGSRATISTGDIPSARFNGDLDVELRSGPEHLALRSTALKIEVADISKPGSAAANGVASLDWTVDGPVAYTSDGLQLNAGKMNIQAQVTSRAGKLTSTGSSSLLHVSSTDPAVAADKMDLTWETLDLETLTGKLTTTTQGFSARFEDRTWKGFDLHMSYTLQKDNDISGTGKLVFASGPELPLEFAGSTQTMRWDIRLAPASIKLAKLRSLLSVAGVKPPASVKMTDGYLDVQGDIKVADNVSAKMLVSGHGLAASMHNSRVLGAGFTLNAGYDETPRASGPLSIETLELAGGIDLMNIGAELDIVGADRFELKNLRADMFDGEIELGKLLYADQEIADTTVRFSHVNLGKLLAYADIDGLQGSGFLDISLPIGSDKTGIHVKDGTFISTGPGRLAYTKEGVAGSNIGLKALENFQFKSLSGTLNYKSDGAYVVTVRLEGSNPDLYEGHAVVFNLNINGSLPALFEAMFMTGSFEESILKEIRKQ